MRYKLYFAGVILLLFSISSSIESSSKRQQNFFLEEPKNWKLRPYCEDCWAIYDDLDDVDQDYSQSETDQVSYYSGYWVEPYPRAAQRALKKWNLDKKARFWRVIGKDRHSRETMFIFAGYEIIMGRDYSDALPADELAVVLLHELGHAAAIRKHLPRMSSTMQEELRADRFTVCYLRYRKINQMKLFYVMLKTTPYLLPDQGTSTHPSAIDRCRAALGPQCQF